MSIKSKLLIFLVPSMLILFGILIFANLKITEKTVLEHIGHEAHYAALSIVNEINALIESSQKIAEGVARSIEIVPELKKDFIKKLLKANVEENPGIYGSTISFSPAATKLGYYGPYYYRSDGGVKYKSLDSSYDYTKWDWFRIPMETGKGSWGEPYYDEGGGNILMVTYSVPVFRNNIKIGIATIDISLDSLVHKIQSLRVDITGYAILVSSKGYIIAHPNKELLLKRLSPDHVIDFKDQLLEKLSALMTSMGVHSSAITDPITGKSWIITMPIKSAQWTLGIIYPYNEILRPIYNLHYVLGVISLIIAALMLVLILWISSSTTSPILDLVRHTEHYAAGDFKDRLDEAKGPKEIQKLSSAFNVMGGAIEQKIQELRDTQKEIVFHLARAAEYRDNDTGMHIKRMSHYCALLGKAYGLNDEECDLFLHASSMHDIGKIGISDAVLLKKGKLEPDEWKTMQTHVQIGEEILSGGNSKLIQMAQIIAYTHHERWYGLGYPRGMKGEDIPIVGRIVCLCDVFDSLTSERPYKNAWTVDEALNEIEINKGKIFDPYLVDLFKQILPDILDIKGKFAG